MQKENIPLFIFEDGGYIENWKYKKQVFTGKCPETIYVPRLTDISI